MSKINIGEYVVRRAAYRDANWNRLCASLNKKPDGVFKVTHSEHNYSSIMLEGVEKREWYAPYFKVVDSLQCEESNTLDNNPVTQSEHHPLCDYMTSNCVEKCDCKTEWFKERMAKMEKEEASNNMVTQPKHYEFFEGVEAITIIARSMTEKQFAGYCMGNALKYRLRAGKKFNTEEDLKKADYYKELFQKHRHECIDEDI